MFNATPQHSYSRVPVEAPEEHQKKNPEEPPSLWSRVTFGWVPGRLSTTDQQSNEGLVPGHRSAWWNYRNLRHAWFKHARSTQTREEDPRLWRAVVSFVLAEGFTRMFLFPLLILCIRVLQPAMFTVLLTFHPFLMYGSVVPWICAVLAGYWLAVSLESLARSHYAFFAHLITASVKSGLTGLVYNKVLRLKQTTFADYPTSHVMNLISKDLDPIGQCVHMVPVLFTAPLELCIISLLLLVIIGWEALAGIAYMLVCTMLRCGVGRVFRKLRHSTAFFTDQRLLMLSEVISGIQTIKMNVWERAFENLFNNIRRQELSYIKRKALVLGALLSVQHAVPIVSSLVSIVTLMMRGKELTHINIFLIILTMYILDGSCGDAFAKGIEVLVRTVARLNRIERFLMADFPSLTFYGNTTNRSEESTEGVHCSSGLLTSNSAPRLSLSGVCCDREYDLADIELNYVTFSYEGAQLVTFTGPPQAGAGTSLVFEAILDEVPLKRGRIVQEGTLAYVCQKPWIFSGTVRENILFGEPYSEDRFAAVVRACKLDKTIDFLPNGNTTSIGNGSGIKLTLSQRERLNLARAAYSSASIILLDNPLSHVDTPIANEIFDECIKDFLGSRLRLVVTRRADFLERSPRVLLMADGIIIREGSLAKIKESGENLTWLRKENGQRPVKDEELEITASVAKEESTINSEAEGSAVYLRYARQAGCLPVLFTVGVLLTLAPGAVLAALGILFARTADLSQDDRHSSLPTVLVAAFMLLLLIRALFLLACGFRSSKRIHDRALSTLLRAPVLEFEAENEDTILKEFSKDVERLDEKLPPDILMFFQSVVEHTAVAAIIKFTAPWTILAAIPAFLIALFIGRYYVRLERHARSLERRSLKPLLTHFSDAIEGAITIRACQKEKYFTKEFFRLENQHTMAGRMRSAAEQWLAVRHLAVMSLFMCIASVIVIFTSDSTLVALSLTFDRQLVVGITIVPFLFTDIEQGMAAAARLMNYFDIRSEPGYENDTKPPEDWPSEGSVSIGDLLLASVPGRRRSSHETFMLLVDIGPREKVCITGQKDVRASSLAAKLMLMSKESFGEVLVDETSLSTLNLAEARKAFCVLQREPFIFTSSLRKNLDPEGIHEDGEIWHVLEAVRMKDYVEELPRQLNYIVTQPSRFSDSQLMLLSLARALLMKRRIIILDEVLPGIDFNTLRIINNVIKNLLNNCTVITVAYGPISLETILYHDRVIVTEGGRIVEMGSPRALLERENCLLSRYLTPV